MERFASACLRLAECCLPVPVFLLLLFPVAAVMATRQLLIGNGNVRQLRQLSEAARLSGTSWRRCSLWRVWTAQLAMSMARLTRYWPEKLREPRWSRRCRFVGLERLEAILAEGRPVVLATLHYGELTQLYHWTRSRGIGLAFLVTRKLESDQAYFNQFDLLANRANGLEGVPALVEIGHLQLWKAREFLADPNRVLAVAMDRRSSRDIVVQGPGYALRMAPGALHLAAMAQAVVIPCLISSRLPGPTIVFGKPLPDDVVTLRDRHHLACEQILRELAPWISAQPEQSEPHLLNALQFPGR